MNRLNGPVVATGVGVLFLLILDNFNLFRVDQKQQALLVRLGDPVRTVTTPGLHVKSPFDTVIRFDKRNIEMINAQPEEVTAADQERLVVDAFVRYRITDARQFYRTLGQESVATDRLDRIVN